MNSSMPPSLEKNCLRSGNVLGTENTAMNQGELIALTEPT